MRLNKYIADSGFCSRREADRLVGEGRVTVNGVRARIGAELGEGDKVLIDGNPLAVRTAAKGQRRHVYIALNKPVGITSTTESDVKGNIVDPVAGMAGLVALRGMRGKRPPASRSHFVTTAHGLNSPSRYSAIMARGERVICVSRLKIDAETGIEAAGKGQDDVAGIIGGGHLADILVSEEEHVDWIETQLSLIERIGEPNYLAQQLDKG